MSSLVLCTIVLFMCVCAGRSDPQEHGNAATPAATAAEPLVVTRLGAVRGSVMSTRRGRGFHAFRGLPYAQPPVGDLRFRSPRPLARYERTVDARREGPACPQPALEPGFFVDEDCLRLNVYTPNTNSNKTSDKLLPVIVYLHPGGFYSVSGRSDVAGPHYLLDRDLVLVTINYRLASLGFLSTGDEHAPGNAGFKDQVMALRWVRDNIAAFGGDPNSVTLAGYSAGSLSIGLLMVSPMAKNLFHRAISMSASPISQVVIGHSQRHLAARQAALLGCPAADNEAMVACLRAKPWREIGDSLDAMFEFGYDPVLLWNVVVEPRVAGEEPFLTEQPLDAIRAGRFHAVPYIVSQTTDEFFWKAFNIRDNATLFNTMSSEWERIAPISFMLPPHNAAMAARTLQRAYFGSETLTNDSNSMAALGKLYSDAVIGFAAHRMAKLMCHRSKQPVYFYEFAYVGNHSHYQDPATGKPVGAAHHDDLIYVFSIPALFPNIELGSPDDVIVDRMTAIWYNFATHGDPNGVPESPVRGSLRVRWPPMTSHNYTYLRIAEQASLHDNLFEDRYRVWEQLYPIEY